LASKELGVSQAVFLNIHRGIALEREGGEIKPIERRGAVGPRDPRNLGVQILHGILWLYRF